MPFDCDSISLTSGLTTFVASDGLEITEPGPRLRRDCSCGMAIDVSRIRPARDLRTVSDRCHSWLAANSITILRVSVGFVFFTFGMLKFFPGLSPAEHLAKETVGELTFGLVPGGIGIILVAAIETMLGLCLMSGRWLRLGMGLLGIALIGVLSPLALFFGQLFPRAWYEPTLTAQYVLMNVVLLGAALVIGTASPGRKR